MTRNNADFQQAALFHGTVHPFQVGDTVLPRSVTGESTVHGTEPVENSRYPFNDETVAYATPHQSVAEDMAKDRAEALGDTPKVFEVEPVDEDDLRPDPHYFGVSSKKGFRVVKQVK